MEQEKNNFKGKMSDIKEENSRDRMVLSKQLETAFDKAPAVQEQ